MTKRIHSFVLLVVILTAFASMLPLERIDEGHVSVMVLEWKASQRVVANTVPSTDNSMSNPHYRFLSYHWYTTASYWIDTRNAYGFSASAVATAISASANAWDIKTSKAVFSYRGTTTRSAGVRDYYNVVAWGSYRADVLAVTHIWYVGSHIVEADTRMNTYYRWSLWGQAGKLDVRNIVTHEFGHWAGLADLYSSYDYWLTMYGYSSLGQTCKRTLGLGDIKGVRAVYGY